MDLGVARELSKTFALQRQYCAFKMCMKENMTIMCKCAEDYCGKHVV